ncbi:hypothetical protein ECE50_010140 [Chitinophaga sp. Mgbs1]|uniref:Terpene synthase n=1 Tax=Chitinophaga solisilvae TaxID=1233460 RepID=A0A433WDJ5_9BACT|nr:hypothetical protein [Chitinophaga solisilvae]
MKSILERLDYPFPHADSPYAPAIQDFVTAWIDRLQLPDHIVARYRKSQLGNLGTRFYPFAGRAVLEAAALHLLLLFAFDDLYANQDPEVLQLHADQAIHHLQGHTTNSTSAVVREFSLLGRLLLENANEAWLQQYINNIKQYFTSMISEAYFTRTGIFPSVSYYKIVREQLVGLHQMVDLLEPANQTFLPAGIINSPFIHTLRKSAVLAMSWLNDIVSYPKELREGEIFNLVLLMTRENGGNLPAAMDAAVHLHNKEIAHLIQTAAHPPDFGSYNDAVAGYVKSIQYMITGHKVWSELTARYVVAD